MPCYAQNLISVELKVADTATLRAALDALGLKYTEKDGLWTIQTPAGVINIRNGQAEFLREGCQAWVNKIKQAYSTKTVQKIAKKFKFTIAATGNNQMVLRRY